MISEEIIKLLQLACDNVDHYSNLNYSRREELRRLYEQTLAADPIVQESKNAVTEWNNTWTEILTELFSPGTLIHISGEFFVVDTVSQGRYLNVFKVPSKAKHPTKIVSIHTPEVVREYVICTTNDIQDKKLRTAAEKLIARIRLKDW